MCGMSATLSCSSCRSYNIRTKYCSQSCQRADWKEHKQVCGVKNPKAVAHESVAAAGLSGGWASKLTKPGEKCTRCLGDRNDGLCRVPHPVMERDFTGSTYSSEAFEEGFFCRACEQTYTVETTRQGGKKHKSGPRYCYEGEHTTVPLAKGDARRVQPRSVYLTESSNLQRQIMDIPEDTFNLFITREDGGFNHEGKWVFERKLPNLRELRLENVKFSRLVLNSELTPELRKLKVVNLGDTCDIRVQCPKLKDIGVHYLSPDEGGRDVEQINEMLRHATKLVRFDSYKLWVTRPLEFASNHLESIYVHRSDNVVGLRIWAPNLKVLTLQANYGLEFIKFLEDHPLKASLPEGHVPPMLEVSTPNCILTPAAKRDLEAHPTAVIESDDDDDDEGGRDFGAGLVENAWVRIQAEITAIRESNPELSFEEVLQRANDRANVGIFPGLM